MIQPGKILSSKQMHGTKKYIERESLMGNQQLYNEDSITFLLEAEICKPGTRVSSGGDEEVEEEKESESLLSRDLLQILRLLISSSPSLPPKFSSYQVWPEQ